MIKNINFIVILMIISFLFFMTIIIFKNLNNKEGFEWKDETLCKYKEYIKTFNPTYRFNIETMKKNATNDEINYLLNKNTYIWSDETKIMFLNNIKRNNIIKIEPLVALNQAMNVYPESVIRKKLFWDTNEGKFILYGGIINDKKNPFLNLNDTIKCEIDDNGKAYMYKKIMKGVDIYSGYQKCSKVKVEDYEIPNIMPGFSFLKEPCNPCEALNDKPNYSCSFKLNIKNRDL